MAKSMVDSTFDLKHVTLAVAPPQTQAAPLALTPVPVNLALSMLQFLLLCL